MFAAERTEQADFDQSHFFAAGLQVFHRLQGGFTSGTHDDDHTLRVGCPEIIKQVDLTTGQHGEAVHGRLHPVGAIFVIPIRGFT